MVTVSGSVAVYLYHTVRPMLPNDTGQESGRQGKGHTRGSPVSVLATIVLRLSVYVSGDALRAFAKLSLVGTVPASMRMLSVPPGKPDWAVPASSSLQPICVSESTAAPV